MSAILHPHAGKVVAPGFGREKAVDYNAIDRSNFVEKMDERRAEIEMAISREIGRTLVRAYPGREWRVAVNLAINPTDGGTIAVALPALSDHLAYLIHLKNRTMDELKQLAIRGGGEALERFNLSRTGRVNSDDQNSDAIERCPLTGEALSDDAAPAKD